MRPICRALLVVTAAILPASVLAQEGSPPPASDGPAIDPESPASEPDAEEQETEESLPVEEPGHESPPDPYESSAIEQDGAVASDHGEPDGSAEEAGGAHPSPPQEVADSSEGPVIELPDELLGDDGAEPVAAHEGGGAGEGIGGALGSLPIGGYGELHYNMVAPAEGDRSSVLDLHRMVLFVAHRFGFGLAFNLELEVEHAFVAGADSPGEVAIEQAYVDYPIVGRYLGVRAGIVLVPMGIINPTHEPPTFNGVERPMMSRSIIPTTWREGGIGLYGELSAGLQYEVYLLTGLDAGGFSLGSGLRGGRQHVAKATFEGIAVAGRLQYAPTPWLTAGIAGYWSQTGPNARDLNASCDADGNCQELEADVPVVGGAADLRLRWRGIEARGEVALFSVGDTERLRAAVDGDGEAAGVDVGSILFGAYVELGWDVLSLIETRHQLVPFVRYEYYDTTLSHDDPTVEGSRATHDLVFGVSYRPIRQIAFKMDVILRNPGDGDVLFNAGVGWMF